MRMVHGISGATKKSAVDTPGEMRVLVTDGNHEVILSMTANSYPAGLTPDQARALGAALIQAADRVEGQ